MSLGARIPAETPAMCVEEREKRGLPNLPNLWEKLAMVISCVSILESYLGRFRISCPLPRYQTPFVFTLRGGSDGVRAQLQIGSEEEIG